MADMRNSALAEFEKELVRSPFYNIVIYDKGKNRLLFKLVGTKAGVENALEGIVWEIKERKPLELIIIKNTPDSTPLSIEDIDTFFRLARVLPLKEMRIVLPNGRVHGVRLKKLPEMLDYLKFRKKFTAKDEEYVNNNEFFHLYKSWIRGE